MVLLTISIVLFNLIAFMSNKRMTANQIAHIWAFTIAFQNIFDLIVEFKYKGYWYFSKDVDWAGLLAHFILVPPVNMIFLNRFPFKAALIKKASYISYWVAATLIYESITLLPQPWGFFHFGWWNLGYSAVLDPILFLILLGYYKWICKWEDLLKAVSLRLFRIIRDVLPSLASSR